MKVYTLLIILQFSILHLFGQVVTTDGDKVVVRDVNGKFIASGYYSEMNDAIAGDKIVVIWYKNDKVEVRSQELKYISSSYYSSLKEVATSGTNIILYYMNKKVEVRDAKLKFISSHY